MLECGKLSLACRVWVELKRNQMGLLLEAQYQHDFTKLIDLPVSATSGGMEIKNRAFVVCAGLKYYLP